MVSYSPTSTTAGITRTGSGQLIRRALQADAAACAVSGAVLTVAAGPLGGLFDLPTALLRGAGIAMLVLATGIGWLATRQPLPRRLVVAVVVVNLLWAVDSVALLFTGWIDPNGLGVAFIVAQAVIVFGIAELEYVGLRR